MEIVKISILYSKFSILKGEINVQARVLKSPTSRNVAEHRYMSINEDNGNYHCIS